MNPMKNLQTYVCLLGALSLVLGLMAITPATAAPKQPAPAAKPTNTANSSSNKSGSTQQKIPPSHNQGPLNLPGY
jgi:hypothetical protein